MSGMQQKSTLCTLFKNNLTCVKGVMNGTGVHRNGKGEETDLGKK